MRIITQLKNISSLTIVALVVLAPILLWSFAEFKSARKDYILADAIKANFFESASFRDQYFLYREDRAHRLFDKSNESLNSLLNKADAQFHGDESRDTLQHLRRNIEDSTIIFHRITDNTETFKTAADNREIYSELDRRLFSQLLLRATAARDEATSLKDVSANRVERTYKHLAVIIGLFAVTLALATTLTATHLGRLIRKRLASLHNGAKTVADGNLAYRIEAGGGDEFSDLARSINTMTDKLNDEIAKRREREEQLAEAQTIARLGSWHVIFGADESQDIWTISKELRRLYGYADDKEIDFSSGFVAMPPEDRELTQRYWAEARRGTGPMEWDHRIIVNGEIRWMHVSAKFVFDAQGKALEAHGTNQDITERKRIEDQIRELNRDFVSFLENTSDFIYFKDAESRFRFCSQTLANITGHESWRNMIGKHDMEVFPPDTARIYYEEELPIFREGKPLLNKIDPYYDAEGSPGWVSTSKWPLRDHEGKVTGLFGISRDITASKRAELALQRESEKNLALLRNASDGIHILDAQGNVIEASDSFCAMLGYTRAEMIGMNVACWDAQFSDAERAEKIRQQFALPQRSLFETRHRRKDGSIFDVEVSGFPLELGGQPVLFNSSRDITERKAAERKLQKSEASQRAILDNVPYLIWLKDIEGHFVAVNKAFFNTTGLPRIQDVLGKTDFDLWPEHLAQKYRADDAEVLSMRRQKLTEEMSMDNGEAHWVETFKAPIMDMEGNLLGTTGFAQDITVRKNAEGKIRHLAHYDPLTDLPNRTLFSDRLQQALVAAKRDKAHMALMFIDLDKFKPINDELGHHVGDLLLKEVAKRMQDCMRESDTVARIGGDEFVVLLPVIEAEQDAMLVAEKIREELNRPFVLVGKSLSISSSTGIAVYPEHGKDETQLMKNADVAMYHAKEGGRNSVVLYHKGMRGA